MTKLAIPEACLEQHLGILGKTGSGKTSTGKLAIEQIVASGGRVCILDPTKSDHWGLISSADGKRPGLPFTILGGPRGHVPLHASAGKAIAEIVASGALPLSILDMADFGPGGHMQFFVDFAPVLLRKMRGVLYLVIEEAHEFAPKERAGFGAENMAIHYAKKLATAGRSKGIRMIVMTQRTQSLHNAILGSCDTMITHRFTAPADQEPVIKWLKANVKDSDIREEIVDGMSSLQTGEGWICSGEAKIFEKRKFPRIHTFDNSATPKDDADLLEVKTAPVDQDKLRTLIGDAVKEAEENDPRLLKQKVARLERSLAEAQKPAAIGSSKADLEAEYSRGRDTGFDTGYAQGRAEALTGIVKVLKDTRQHLVHALSNVDAATHETGMAQLKAIPAYSTVRPRAEYKVAPAKRAPAISENHEKVSGKSESGAMLTKAERLVLTALAQYPNGRTKVQVAVITGYAVNGGGFNNSIGSARSRGFLEGTTDRLAITQAGIDALGNFDPLPHGDDLLQHWYRQLSRAERASLEALAGVYPRTLTKEEVAQRAGYEANGGGFNNALGRLRTFELISGGREALQASPDLFD